jgi:hypothetical protein
VDGTLGDVWNVKNEPAGAGHVVGTLAGGTKVRFEGTCAPQSWCEVSGANIPNGRGWMWGLIPD